MHANGAFGTDTGSIAPALAVTPPAALLTALADAEAAALARAVTAPGAGP